MYIILEIQEATPGATPATLTFVAETKEEAFSKWHEVLMYAAISTIYRHTAIIMTTDGKYLACEHYDHFVEGE